MPLDGFQRTRKEKKHEECNGTALENSIGAKDGIRGGKSHALVN